MLGKCTPISYHTESNWCIFFAMVVECQIWSKLKQLGDFEARPGCSSVRFKAVRRQFDNIL